MPAKSSGKATDLKRILWSFGSTGLLQVVNFTTGVIIARSLGPEGRGEVSLIIAWMGLIASLCLLGTNDALTYFISKYHRNRHLILNAGVWIVRITSIAGIAIAATAILTVFPDMSPDANIGAWMFLSYIPLYQFNQIAISYYQASHNIKLFSALRIIPGITYVTALLLFLVIDTRSVTAVLFSYSLSLFAMIVFCVLLIRRDGFRPRVTNIKLRMRMFRFGRPLVFQKISTIARDNADRIILPFFITTASLGHYVVAAAISYLITIVGMAFDLVTFPSLSRATIEDRRRKAELFLAAAFWAIFGSAIILALLSRFLIETLFGEAFREAADFAPYFVVAGALHSWRVVAGSVLKAFRQARSLVMLESLSATLLLILLVALPPRFEAYGGVYAHVISATLASFAGLILLVVVARLNLLRLFVPSAGQIASLVSRVWRPAWR